MYTLFRGANVLHEQRIVPCRQLLVFHQLPRINLSFVGKIIKLLWHVEYVSKPDSVPTKVYRLLSQRRLITMGRGILCTI